MRNLAAGPLFVTGSSGFVGRNLVAYFRRHTTVVGADARPSTSAGDTSEILDLCDAPSVTNCLTLHRPSAVIHAAGNKNMRFCQDHPDQAQAVNADATANVARACRQVGARLIYLSTDLVFDSTRGNYNEDDQPGTSLVYGQTKYQGELAAQSELPEVAICRSGGIYGRNSPLLLWLASEVRAGKEVHCFTDIYNTPTYVDNLAEMMLAILTLNLHGIFHTVGSQRVNRFDFFASFCQVFSLGTSTLVPTRCDQETEKLLLRPDSSLNCLRTQQKFAMAGAKVRFDTPDQGLTRLREAGGF